MAKNITCAKKFCGMSASLTIFLCSAIIFVKTKGMINFETLLYTLYIVVPGALIVGTLGYYTGKIFDGKKKKRKLNKFIR